MEEYLIRKELLLAIRSRNISFYLEDIAPCSGTAVDLLPKESDSHR